MERESSRTAVLVAAYRARATEAPGAICHDPWARQLAWDEGHAVSLEYDRLFPSGELWVGLRTRVLDEQVLRFTPGMTQVVVLGAGLDTRAARLARPGVRFFEVDHPSTQADKLQRLRRAKSYPVECATYVACDFETDDFLDKLTAAGFSTREPAVILWEGVIYYLTESAARATLRRLAQGCHPSSVVLFDSMAGRFVGGRSKREEDARVREGLAGMGEPLIFGLDDPLPLLFDEGFRHVRTISFDEAALTYTGTYERARTFRFQRITLCSVDGKHPL